MCKYLWGNDDGFKITYPKSCKNCESNENVERLILKGKLTVPIGIPPAWLLYLQQPTAGPGENKELDIDDLVVWWEKYFQVIPNILHGKILSKKSLICLNDAIFYF